MNLSQRFIVVASILLSAALTIGAELPSIDELSLKEFNESLAAKVYGEHDAAARKSNFVLAFPLARIAFTNRDLSPRIRLAVLATTGNACERAMRASSSPTFGTYHECPEATNALTLVEMLSTALVTIPKGLPGSLNVMPPVSGDGVFAAGQSPEGIKDPTARLAYEEAIAENKKRIEESNARHDVELALRGLENALYSVGRGLRANGNKAPHPFFDRVRDSGIPSELKQRILELE